MAVRDCHLEATKLGDRQAEVIFRCRRNWYNNVRNIPSLILRTSKCPRECV